MALRWWRPIWCDHLTACALGSELSPIERTDQIAEWIRLTEERQEENDPHGSFSENGKVGAGRGNEGGVRAASRDRTVKVRPRSPDLASGFFHAKSTFKMQFDPI